MGGRQRSAPESWGEWPPPEWRVRQIAERAARRLGEELAAGDTRHVLLVVPEEASTLDRQYGPSSQFATIGRVLVIGGHQAWIIHWNPATDEGVVRRTLDAKV